MNFEQDILEYLASEFQQIEIELHIGDSRDVLLKLFTIQEKSTLDCRHIV